MRKAVPKARGRTYKLPARKVISWFAPLHWRPSAAFTKDFTYKLVVLFISYQAVYIQEGRWGFRRASSKVMWFSDDFS